MSMRTLLGLAIAAFLLGGIATWVLAGSPGLSSFDLFTFKKEEPAAPRARPAPAPTLALPVTADAAQQIEEVAQQQGGLDQRVAAMEQRLSRLDMQTQAAAGNAARAEGLLVTFAVRRTIERGGELGVLADQLRLRFGDAQPNAVRTVIEAARHPVTLDQLVARLDGLAPELAGAPPREGMFGWLSRELGSLFVVRREDSPSPQPERRLERARLFLETGRARAAVAEVRNLPNAAGARDWIADATRYANAQDALERIELAAIQEPRDLRDAQGRNVEQRSPVAAD
jgi:outer membrane murein-binding lipoprotein Lpp